AASQAPGSPVTATGYTTLTLPMTISPEKPRFGLRYIAASGSYDFNGINLNGRVSWYAVDNTAPVITNYSPADQTTGVLPHSTISANVADASLQNATMKLDGQSVTTISRAGAISYTSGSPLSSGMHQVVVTATDSVGNTTSPPAQWSFTV